MTPLLLITLRPEWQPETLKVVMTGSAEDGPDWQKHIGNKQQAAAAGAGKPVQRRE